MAKRSLVETEDLPYAHHWEHLRYVYHCRHGNYLKAEQAQNAASIYAGRLYKLGVEVQELGASEP